MTAERFTLDTNILAYSIDKRDPRKQDIAIAILEAAARKDCPLAIQCIGEFYVTAVRKLKIPPQDAAVRARKLMTSFETFTHSANAMKVALEEAALMRFSLWDGVLLASAAENGCTAIFSEDMADGAHIGTIAVRTPFSSEGMALAARAALEL